MKKLVSAVALACSLLALPAMAGDVAAVPAVVIGATIKADAEVVAIDLATRKVSLKDKDGKVLEMVVGPKVKNLAQVKVGDRVLTQYTRALSVRFKKGGGIRETVESADSSTAAPGEKPAATVAQEVHFVADIIGLNPAKGDVKIKGASGKVYDFRVKNPKALADVKVGDQVEGTFLQVLAIGVVGPKAVK